MLLEIRIKWSFIEEVTKQRCDDDVPVFDKSSCEDIGANNEEEEGLALMITKTFFKPKEDSDEELLRTNVIYTACNFGGIVCNMIVYARSCENLVC